MENNSNLSFEEEEEFQKQIISLLLSGADRPIKQKLALQKELFLLSRAFPKLQNVFQFIPHKYGPYSNDAEYIIENNVDLFIENSSGISLTPEGIEYSEKASDDLEPEKRDKLMKAVSMIRDIYDGLTNDEFMFLIYSTYGFTEKSEKYDKLMKNKSELAKRLYHKKVITLQRYKELSED